VNADRFEANGQPLVFVCEVGAACAPAADETFPESLSQGGWKYFRVKAQSLQARYFLSPNGQTWVIQQKNGVTLELGAPLTNSSFSATPATDIDPAAETLVFRWHLVRQVDTSGANVVVYGWQRKQPGLAYLTDIWDTPPVAGTQTTTQFEHHTQLDWESHGYTFSDYATRPDRRAHYYRLLRVSTASKPWTTGIDTTADGVRNIVREYTISYKDVRGDASAPTDSVAALWHHSFPKSIRTTGACGVEDRPDHIPPSECGGQPLPVTSFSYENAAVSALGGVASNLTGYVPADTISVVGPRRVSGPDPILDVGNYGLSSSLVDVDRDGFPDVVVGMNEYPPPAGGGWPEGAIRQGNIWRNKGPDSGGSLPSFSHACADQQEILNIPLRAPDLFMRNGYAVLGPWGPASLLWSGGTYYGAIGAVHLPPGTDGSGFCSQSGADPGHELWRWHVDSSYGWMRDVSSPLPNGTWILDGDGDGLPDKVSVPQTFPSNHRYVPGEISFTRRYGANTTTDLRPQLRPFDEKTDAHSTIPWDSTGGQFSYADMDGDGVSDLIWIPTSGGTPALVRPGNGKGEFGCPTGTGGCTLAPGDSNVALGYPLQAAAPSPWHDIPNPEQYLWWFHDVTGDGLADLVAFRTWLAPSWTDDAHVLLWINVDGTNLVCGNPSDPHCEVGRMFWWNNLTQDTAAQLNVQGGWGHSVPMFADMDANGTDDLVWVRYNGIYVMPFVQSPFGTVAPGHSSKAGLLTKIDNGMGATTLVSYDTVPRLDKLAARFGTPWTRHAPVAVPVVTQTVTRSSAPPAGKSVSPEYIFPDAGETYTYTDPAFNMWTQSLVGFGKVVSQAIGSYAAEETTFWFSPCDLTQMGLCPDGSDDAATEVLSGRRLMVNQYVPGVPGQQASSWLASTVFSFPEGTRSLLLNQPPVDRHFYDLGVLRTDTRIYDTSLPLGPTQTITAPDGSTLSGPPTQAGAHTVGTIVTLDELGNTYEIEELGEVDDIGGPSIGGSRTNVNAHICDPTWFCYTFVHQVQRAGEYRTSVYAYNRGNLYAVAGILETASVLPLIRSHELGWATAPIPSGSTPGYVYRASYVQDAFGNNVQVTEAGLQTDLTYDSTYGHFVTETSTHAGTNPDGTAHTLVTDYLWDRGFGILLQSNSASTGAIYTNSIDAYGRPVDSFAPATDGRQGLTAQVGHIDYSWGAGYLAVTHTALPVAGIVSGVVTTTTMNAMGQVVYESSNANPGDAGSYVNVGPTTYDALGNRYSSRGAWFSTSSPLTTAAAGTSLTAPATAPQQQWGYDSFSRPTSYTENGHALWTVSRRGFTTQVQSQFQKATGAYSFVTMNGFGETVTDGSSHDGDRIWSSYLRNVAGQPVQITQGHANGGQTVTRTIAYDTLGRMVQNVEPNTGSTVGWRYAWDDNGNLIGTSDPRGCGENFFYDDAHRLVAEDYSPCLGSQQPYSPITQFAHGVPIGDGVEALYEYDNYEPGQEQPETGFDDRSSYGAGKLTAVQDRGAHTRFNYDARGRTRRTSRQIARPTVDPPSNRFAPHWYDTLSSFDNGDRLVAQRARSYEPALAFAGEMNEWFSYDARGLLHARGFRRSASSTPQTLTSSIKYDADGLPLVVQHGDASGVVETFTYSDLRELYTYNVSRASKPSFWSSPPAFSGYTKPPTAAQNLVLVNQTLTYDVTSGQLTDLSDTAGASQLWPGGAAPATTNHYVYDQSSRLLSVQRGFGAAAGAKSWVSPHAAETAAQDHSPVPSQAAAARSTRQDFQYDWLGNTSYSSDNEGLFFDRSLGNIQNGMDVHGGVIGPNQIGSAGAGKLQVSYDAAGNVTSMVVQRPGTCENGACVQRTDFDWDEVGQLVAARRYDYPLNSLPAGEGTWPTHPSIAPTVSLEFAYSMGNRVRKSVTVGTTTQHDLDPSAMQRMRGTTYQADVGEYNVVADTLVSFLSGGEQVIHDAGMPSVSHAADHVIMTVGNRLGSAAVAIDYETAEVVERTDYLAYGQVEGDARSARWSNTHNPYNFTGKEEDRELGLHYFGARYYSSNLGRWLSPDPLALHGLGGDPNPYAYVRGQVTNSIDPFGLDGCIGKECGASGNGGGGGGGPADSQGVANTGRWFRNAAKDVGHALSEQGKSVGAFFSSGHGATAVKVAKWYASQTSVTAPTDLAVKTAADLGQAVRQGQVVDAAKQVGVRGTGLAMVQPKVAQLAATSSAGKAVSDDVAAAGDLVLAAVGAKAVMAAKAATAAPAAAEGAAGSAAERMVNLYHGSQSWTGKVFDLARALAGKPGGSTKLPGIYLTDDALRAATQYGRGGTVTVTRVPASFAAQIRQIGPTGLPEYFVNTSQGTAILNQNVQVFQTLEFLRSWTF
jgi:RHS repeat-associated protein